MDTTGLSFKKNQLRKAATQDFKSGFLSFFSGRMDYILEQTRPE